MRALSPTRQPAPNPAKPRQRAPSNASAQNEPTRQNGSHISPLLSAPLRLCGESLPARAQAQHHRATKSHISLRRAKRTHRPPPRLTYIDFFRYPGRDARQFPQTQCVRRAAVCYCLASTLGYDPTATPQRRTFQRMLAAPHTQFGTRCACSTTSIAGGSSRSTASPSSSTARRGRCWNALRTEWAYRNRRIDVRTPPYILFIEPIYYCNLKCPLCPREKYPDARSDDKMRPAPRPPRQEDLRRDRRLPLPVPDLRQRRAHAGLAAHQARHPDRTAGGSAHWSAPTARS